MHHILYWDGPKHPNPETGESGMRTIPTPYEVIRVAKVSGGFYRRTDQVRGVRTVYRWTKS